MRPNGELPSDPQQADRQAPTRARSYAKARLAVHHRSACPGVKALRNTSPARRQAAKLCYRFGPLTPFRALREPDRRRRDEERLCRSEQRTGNKPKPPLDSKSPIQVRIHLPPAVSLRTIGPSAAKARRAVQPIMGTLPVGLRRWTCLPPLLANGGPAKRADFIARWKGYTPARGRSKNGHRFAKGAGHAQG